MFSASGTSSPEVVVTERIDHGDGVQPQPGGREAAREAVVARMHVVGFGSARQLALAAGTGYNAVNEWLKGERQWPRRETRAKIELALGWEPGELARIGHAADEAASGRSIDRGPQSPELGPLSRGLVLDFAPGALEGLTPTEAQEVQAAAVLAALQRMREIRAARRSEHGSDTDAAGSDSPL